MNPLEILNNALERASRAGCFGLKENAEIFSALQQIVSTISKKDQSIQAKSNNKEEEEGGHTPYPPNHPKG